MNILYICPRLPYPPQGGDKTVICNQLKFLSRNNKITLLSLIEDDKELRTGLSGLSPYCAKVEVFRKRPNFSISNFLTVARKTDPFTVIRYYSPRMHKRAKELVESADFDIVHVAFYYMAQYAVSKDIRVPSKTALVIDTHLVEYLLYDAHGRLAKNPFLKLFSKLEAARIKRYEFPIYAKFDRCMTFSELDKANIVKMSGASNVVVNPAPTELPVPEKEIFAGRDEEKNTVLFFGGLKYVPNEDGVKFFYESVFPLIKKKMPGVRFIIAGKSMPRYLVRLAKDPSVRFVGFVPDIREFMKKVSLVIVPLRIGGGIRIKILDAWAAAKAVVSTSAGAEGLSIKNGEDIVIADTPRAFAGEVISLLKDGARRELIGRKAFTKVRELYGLEKVGAELERIYKDAVFEITKEPLTDIVVLNFNQERYTSECLFSLRNMAYKNFRVILVDNGSNDGSGRRLKNKFPEVELLESGQNLGFAGGCNRGIRRSLETGQADYILLLNNDTLPGGALMTELLAVARLDERAGIVGATNVEYSAPYTVQIAAHKIIWWLGIHRVVRNIKERYKQVQSVSGSCMLIKRSVIDRIGLLDERFFAYYEDSDFCLRATRAGFNVVASRNARIRHKMKNTLGSRTPQEYYIYVRNQPLFMIKNCPWIFWPDYFAMYLLKALARIAYFSVTGRPDIAGAVKNGLVDAFSRNFGKGRVFG